MIHKHNKLFGLREGLVDICWERADLLALRLCCFNCLCSFPIWCLGKDVEFDCIDS